MCVLRLHACHSCAISFWSHAWLIVRLKIPEPGGKLQRRGAACARVVRVCNCRFMGSQAGKSGPCTAKRSSELTLASLLLAPTNHDEPQIHRLSLSDIKTRGRRGLRMWQTPRVPVCVSARDERKKNKGVLHLIYRHYFYPLQRENGGKRNVKEKIPVWTKGVFFGFYFVGLPKHLLNK